MAPSTHKSSRRSSIDSRTNQSIEQNTLFKLNKSGGLFPTLKSRVNNLTKNLQLNTSTLSSYSPEHKDYKDEKELRLLIPPNGAERTPDKIGKSFLITENSLNRTKRLLRMKKRKSMDLNLTQLK